MTTYEARVLPAGTTTRHRWLIEWYEKWPGDVRRRRTRVMTTEAEADRWLAQIRPDESPRKYRRDIHTTPFVEVQP